MNNLSFEKYTKNMNEYILEGLDNSKLLDNRSQVIYDENGNLSKDIINKYNKYGFYVFENIVKIDELNVLKEEVDKVIDGAPISPGSKLDKKGEPALFRDLRKEPYIYAKPLSDPLGGTKLNKGRHPSKMKAPKPKKNSPEFTVKMLHGNLHLMKSALRLYGHPDLLKIASNILGDDFVPYNEVSFIKEPGLGPSIAWHRDGTTHWESEDWDLNAHGFNFMIQLYPSTPANCVWVIPGSHKEKYIDIPKLIQKSGTDQIKNAVPMTCNAGDVFMMNRQILHGSFANTSKERRVTINEGFFPRKRVRNITVTHLDGRVETFDDKRINERSKMIAYGINARSNFYRNEKKFNYKHLSEKIKIIDFSKNSWSFDLKDYNILDMYL